MDTLRSRYHGPSIQYIFAGVHGGRRDCGARALLAPDDPGRCPHAPGDAGRGGAREQATAARTEGLKTILYIEQYKMFNAIWYLTLFYQQMSGPIT